VRSSVPVTLQISLKISSESTTVTVEDSGDLVENDPTFTPTSIVGSSISYRSRANRPRLARS